jgi:hypothetical protein
LGAALRHIPVQQAFVQAFFWYLAAGFSAGHRMASDGRNSLAEDLGVSPELHALVMSMLEALPACRPTAQQVNQQIAQLWAVEGGLPGVGMNHINSPSTVSQPRQSFQEFAGTSMGVGCPEKS